MFMEENRDGWGRKSLREVPTIQISVELQAPKDLRFSLLKIGQTSQNHFPMFTSMILPFNKLPTNLNFVDLNQSTSQKLSTSSKFPSQFHLIISFSSEFITSSSIVQSLRMKGEIISF
jgi:hypothetical protein